MKVIIPGVVAGIAAAALVSLAPAANADAGQTVMIRPGGFVAEMSDTRPAGHVDFLKEGLHVYTDDNSSDAKAAEYFNVPAQGLPDTASLTWYGTSPQPGSQLVFDADGDQGTTADGYNVLVGEPAYGDDYWMSTGSSIYKSHHELCPSTTGGSGSDCHGTLAQWQQAFPNAKLYAVGFSLGSGIKGDGVIRDLQVGDTDYRFTSDPATTVVPVTGTATVKTIVRPHVTVLKAHFSTDALGANEVQGAKLRFKVKDNGKVIYRNQMGAGQKSAAKFPFAKGSGKHVVQVLKNGVVDSTTVIKTGHKK
jgi:hypothetical protein